MTNRQRVFIEEYLKCWNASEAARRAGYKGRADVIGPRLLLNVGISAAIEKRIEELSMSANEVLLRLGEHARSDIGEFLDGNVIDLEAAKEKRITHLIKKVKVRTVTTVTKNGGETTVEEQEIELHDAQAALIALGKKHKMFTDNIGLAGGTINLVWDLPIPPSPSQS